MKKIGIMIAAALSVISVYCSPVREALAARSAMTIDSEEGMVEVEYLESTGTQWIDIGFSFSDAEGDVLEIWTAAMSTYSETPNAFRRFFISNGTTAGSSLRVGFYWAQTWAVQVNADWGNIHGSSSIAANRTFYGRLDRINGTLYREQAAVILNISDNRLKGPFLAMPYVLFAADINGSDSYPTRVWYAKFAVDGIVKRDLIPVRVGNIGYMYDRVSGELFGNMGTGNFIIGPDL